MPILTFSTARVTLPISMKNTELRFVRPSTPTLLHFSNAKCGANKNGVCLFKTRLNLQSFKGKYFVDVSKIKLKILFKGKCCTFTLQEGKCSASDAEFFDYATVKFIF